MRVISREKVPIDEAQLESNEVILRRDSSWSFRSFCEGDGDG